MAFPLHQQDEIMSPNLDPGAPPIPLLSQAPLRSAHVPTADDHSDNSSAPDLESVTRPTTPGIGAREAFGTPTESLSATPEYHTDLEHVCFPAAKEERPQETGPQAVEKEVAKVPLARPVPHAPETDPEAAPQAPTLPQQSPPWNFFCPDETVYGQAAPSQAVYSIVRLFAAPLFQPDEPVLHLEVQVAAPATPPLASQRLATAGAGPGRACQDQA